MWAGLGIYILQISNDMHCKASPIVESNLVMEEAWIWYGPDDPVSLSDIRQTGASSVSTALYEIPAGDIWELDKILERSVLKIKGQSREK